MLKIKSIFVSLLSLQYPVFHFKDSGFDERFDSFIIQDITVLFQKVNDIGFLFIAAPRPCENLLRSRHADFYPSVDLCLLLGCGAAFNIRDNDCGNNCGQKAQNSFNAAIDGRRISPSQA